MGITKELASVVLHVGFPITAYYFVKDELKKFEADTREKAYRKAVKDKAKWDIDKYPSESSILSGMREIEPSFKRQAGNVLFVIAFIFLGFCFVSDLINVKFLGIRPSIFHNNDRPIPPDR